MGAAEGLVELVAQTGRATSLEELARAGVDCVGRALGAAGVGLLLAGERRETHVGGAVSEPLLREAAARAGGGELTVDDVAADECLARLAGPAVKALALVPLEVEGRRLGALLVAFGARDADETRSVLRIAAGHLALAVRGRRTERELAARVDGERRARRLAEDEVARRRRLEQHRELLIQAGSTLAESLDVGDTLRALSELVVPDFADWYVVHLVTDTGEIVPAHIAHTDPSKVELAHRVVRRWPTRADAPTGAALAIRTGQSSLVERIDPRLLADVAQDAEHLRLLQELQLESGIVVPLSRPGKTIGAMTLMSAEARRSYSSDDLAFVAALANRAALAIENARLYRETKDARRDAEVAAEHLAMLARAGETIAAALDPEEALERLAAFITENLADYCVAYRLDENDTIRRVAIAHADPSQQAEVESLTRAGPPRLDDSYGAGRVLRTGEPIFAPEISAELLEEWVDDTAHLNVLRRIQPISSLVVPLRARGRTLGALALATTRRSQRHYTEADLALAQELARRAALLIDNARLYAGAVRATRARDEVLAVVSHDLRSPLQSIVTACELLSDAPSSFLERIVGSANHMNRLLEDLLEVTRIDEGRLTLRKESFDLPSFLRDTISVHGPVAEGRHVHLTTEAQGELAAIEADRDRLNQALSNIIDNALKFTPDGGTVRVVAEREPDAVRISVADSGPGIPSEQLPHVFDRFWRAEGTERKGVGLGLAISKGIAEAHGGRIEVTSSPGQGARFCIVLPAQAAPPPARARRSP